MTVKEIVFKAHNIYKKQGLWYMIVLFFRKVIQKIKSNRFLTRSNLNLKTLTPYESWRALNQWNKASENSLKAKLNAIPQAPLISVILPVYNPPIQFLNEAIQSVCDQVYDHWELCIADDCSPDPAIRKTFLQWADKDKRIKVVYRTENGNISHATNTAVSSATGEFLLFLDHDDLLTPDALGEVALYLHHHPETDLVYSDDDKTDVNGVRNTPTFKPDWSPELLLAYMYLGHLWGVRSTLYDTLGGMRIGFEGSQDYDFALRASEQSRHIGHIPRILYHWRAIPGSTALSGKEKPKSFEAGKKAVQEALERRNISATAYMPEWALELGLGLYATKFPDAGPEVTVFLLNQHSEQTIRCLQSLKKTSYQNFLVVVLNFPGSSLTPGEISGLNIKQITGQEFSSRAVHYNQVVKEFSASPYVLFLDNRCTVKNPEWLSQMVGYAHTKGVGTVGARILSDNGFIVHAGVIHNTKTGIPQYAFEGLRAQDPGYGCYPMVSRNYSAVSELCFLTSTSVFNSLNGFNGEDFPDHHFALDFCYRLSKTGKRVVYCAEAELQVENNSLPGFADTPTESVAFKKKYHHKKDAYYNENLSLEGTLFSIDVKNVGIAKEAQKHTRPLRVLAGTHRLNFTGGPLHQFDIVLQLKKEGKIEPIVFSAEDGPLRQVYESNGIEVVILNEKNVKEIHSEQSFKAEVDSIVAQLSALKPDLVYANTYETFYMAYAAKVANIPCVWNIHESSWRHYYNYLSKNVSSKFAESFASVYKLIFVSRFTEKEYLPLNQVHNFVTIHNGLNVAPIQAQSSGHTKSSIRASLGILPEEVVVLSVGSICDRKGQLDIIHALEHLTSTPQKIRVLLVGDNDSDYSAKLKQKLQTLPEEIRSRVTFVKEAHEIIKYYMASDLFILSSKEESYPRVILEAMAFDLPIIATPVFGVKEQVGENVNGFFYIPGDAKTLAKKIDLLVSDPSMRIRLGKNSGDTLGILTDFESMVQGYYTLFVEAYLHHQQLNPEEKKQNYSNGLSEFN